MYRSGAKCFLPTIQNERKPMSYHVHGVMETSLEKQNILVLTSSIYVLDTDVLSKRETIRSPSQP